MGAELESLTARGEQTSAAFAARAERCALLDERLDELDRLQPTRADLRRLLERGSAERGSFGAARPAGAR